MRRAAALLAKPLLMLVILAGVGLVLRSYGLDAIIGRATEYGPVAFVLATTLLCALGVPRQAVSYAAGLAYGLWPGVVVALLAEIAACGLNFWLARAKGRAWATRILAKAGPGRIARVEAFLVANGFSATLTIRLLPLGSNMLFNLLAGASRVRAAPFMLASLLGYLPQTIIFALLGQGVRLSEGNQMALSAGLLLASLAIGIVLLRRRPALA